MNKIFFTTARVILTEIESSDVALLMELDSDPEVMKYLTDGKPTTLEEANAAMDRIMKVIHDHDYRYGFWLALTRETKEFMGWFHFRPGKSTPFDTQNIELGYRMKQKFWGKGYATEVSKELLNIGFNKYDILAVFATAMKSNMASQKVMKKMGMHQVEEFQEMAFPGKDKTAVKYEISRNTWIQNNT